VRVIVTGAAGFVGRHVVETLRARGLDVCAAGHDAEDVRELRLEDEVMDLVRSVAPQGVIHLAAPASPEELARDPEGGNANVVRPAVNLMEALAQHAPGARLLLVSSASAYGRALRLPMDEAHPLAPTEGFGAARAAVEHMSRAYVARGLDLVIARPFTLLGAPLAPGRPPRSPFTDWARAGVSGARELSAAGLELRRDLLDVRDAAEALAVLLERGARGEAYNVCSGSAVTLSEVFAKLAPGAMAIPEPPPRSAPPVWMGDPSRLAALGWRARHSWQDAAEALLASVRGC
jgi:nucleoside-diphosphate-sugar epimerase